MMWIQSGDWNFGAWTVGSRRGTYPTLERSVVEWSHNGDTPRSEGKRYRDTRPWEIQAETWGQEEREIDTNQPTICFFCCFAVAWRSEDNDVIINRTLSYQIRSERYIQKCAGDFFFFGVSYRLTRAFSREFFYCLHVQRWYFMTTIVWWGKKN